MSSITLYQTEDLELINSVLMDETLLPLIGEEGTADPIESFPLIPGLMYIALEEDGVLKGMYTLHPLSDLVYISHMSLLPKYWGGAARLTRAAVKWAFEEFSILKIIGFIPETHTHAIDHAVAAGFKIECVLEGSMISNGVLASQVMVSLSDVHEDNKLLKSNDNNNRTAADKEGTS